MVPVSKASNSAISKRKMRIDAMKDFRKSSLASPINTVMVYNHVENKFELVDVATIASGATNNVALIGVITNANTAPGFPALPNVGDMRLVDINPGTVGGEEVEDGDLLMFTSAGWRIFQENITEATQIEADTGVVANKYMNPTITNPDNSPALVGAYDANDGIRMWSVSDAKVVKVTPQSIAALSPSAIAATQGEAETGTDLVKFINPSTANPFNYTPQAGPMQLDEEFRTYSPTNVLVGKRTIQEMIIATGAVISATHLDLLALNAAGTVVPGQVYKMTDYETRVVHKYDGDVIAGAAEELYLTGMDTGVFSNSVQSVLYPKDVMHYDITRKDLLLNANFDVEGDGSLPASIDNSTNVTFNALTFVAADTFTITYSQALTFDEQIDIYLEDQGLMEIWAIGGKISDLIANGDINVTNTGGFTYDIQILFLGDMGGVFDFTAIEAGGAPWVFQIGVGIVLGSNRGTILHRHDPIQNIKATYGSPAGGMDTADWRAAIGRRYNILGRGYVAPKSTAYTLSVTGSWGTITDTFTTDPLDYSMLATVQNNAQNVTLVGGLAQKNILMTGGMNGMYSPASDGDSYYQGTCTGIVINEGCRHASIVLAGMNGMTMTNNALVEDVVYKVAFNKLTLDGCDIQKNWITPDTQVRSSWKFKDITLTGGITTKTLGSNTGTGSIQLSGGTYNGVNIDYALFSGKVIIEANNVLSDYHQAGFFLIYDNKFTFLDAVTTNVFGANAFNSDCNGNDIVFVGIVTNNTLKAFEECDGQIQGLSNNSGAVSKFDTMTFNNANIYDNTLTGTSFNEGSISGVFNGNTISVSITGNIFSQGMSDSTINQVMSRSHFISRVANQIWNATWTDCVVETELLTAKTYTAVQLYAKITDREGTTLYKRSIVGGSLVLTTVT